MVVPEIQGDKADFSQQRKSLLAAGIRRGEFKISDPILWVEGVPSTQQAVSSTVQPHGPGGDAAEGPADEGQIHGLAISTDDAAPAANTSGDGSSLAHKQSLSNSGREGVVSQATVVPAAPSDQKSEHKRSIFVEDDMAAPSPGSAEKKKARRSGTLRTILRGVFGRKRKTQSKELSPPPSRAGVKHEHSRSDPITSPRIKHSPVQEHARAVSTHNALQALREVELEERDSRAESRQTPVQHMLPFPMNINAPQPESPERSRKPDDYLSFERSPQVHRRRATLPSMVLSAEDSTTLHKMWSTTDLTPIGSASEHSGMGLPSPPIGTAISSASAHPNRRSRSAGALHDMAKRQERLTQLRRRSSEIKYWRASKIDSQQNIQHAESQDTTPICSPRASSTGVAMTEVSEALAETGSSVHEGDLGPVDFASVSSDPVEAEELHEQGMAERLAQLENTMHRLSRSFQEYATQGEAGPVREREFALKPAPRALTPQIAFAPPTPSRSASTSNTGVTDGPQQNPSMRFVQPSRTIPSPSPSKGSSYQPSHISSTTTAVPPASPQNSYLQPSVQFPAAPSSVHSAPQTFSTTIASANSPYMTQAALQEAITPLYNALRYERQIRKALETQVSHLSKDVIELSSLVAQLRKQAAYTSQATLSGPRSPRGSPVKGFGAERSRFSGYDSTDDDTDLDAPLRSPQETWTTPREEHSAHWGSRAEAGMF